MDEVAARLRDALAEAGMSQYRLARIMEPYDPEAVRIKIHRWYHGKHHPREDSARRLSEIFGKPPDYFVTPPRIPGPLISAQLAEVVQKVAELNDRVADLERRLDESV